VGYFDLAVIATLLHMLPVVADPGAHSSADAGDGTPVRVLVVNVHTSNRAFDLVRQLIADENPDVLGLVEVDHRWLAELAPVLASFPGRIEQPRGDNFGIALYARAPLTGEVVELGSSLPSIAAELSIANARLAVIVTHPLPPVSGAAVDQMSEQFDAVAERARSMRPPVLVMGDFNATPWSRPFVRLVERTGLCDSRAGFGLHASFPASSRLLRIPIDHVLASCSVHVRDRRIGRDVGSDHLPVIVDLTVPR
jgi:endonuclease/exonuclease/phosphatase (EEP) superfamily protein YafD